MPGPIANYDPGGEETGVYERWEPEKMVVKKFIDDVSGVEKIHCNDLYISKVKNDLEETQFVHAVQAQCFFDTVRGRAFANGMKLNPKKTTLLCICLLYTSPSPRD